MLKGILKNPLVRQYLIVIAANVNLVAVGLTIAWPSSMIVKLRDENQTVLDTPITEEEGSWIVSISFLVGGIFNFVPPFTLDRLGRKCSLFVLNLPSVVAYLFITFASDLWHLLLGRALLGMAMIFAFTVIPAYASEIASTSIRGSLGTIVQVACALGFVLMMSVGPFVSYRAANIYCICLVVAGLICSLFLPEPPFFLYRKGRISEALDVLTYLRGSEEAAKEELKEYDFAEDDSNVSKWELFKNRIFLKSLALIIVIGVATQFIGLNVVKFYLQTIFEMTQTSLSPEISSVIIGVIELLAAILTSGVTDKFGRKPIFAVSLIGMTVGMVGLGVFFYVTEDEVTIVGFLNFLPMISLVVVVFSFSAGPGSLMWVIFAELLESKARSTGLSIAVMVTGMALFVTSKYFAALMAAIGPAVIFWIFGGNCFLFCLFIMFFIPETKGKSFAEIQIALGGKRMTDVESTPSVK